MKVTAMNMHAAINHAGDYGGLGAEMRDALHAEVQRLYDVDSRASDPELRETDTQATMIRKLMEHNEAFMQTNMALMHENIALMRVITGRTAE